MHKQIIVLRKDLGMRKGKMIAQGCHASLAVLVNAATLTPQGRLLSHPDIDTWLAGSFTKIAVSVNSEEELLRIYDEAQKQGLLCSLITDSGKTEFNGVPTKTAVAVGPALSERLDPLTGHLPLL